MIRVLDLFSGSGAFSLGLHRTGEFETVAYCEIAPYAQQVLRKHHPRTKIYKDVCRLTASRLADDGLIPIDMIVGGFPCQNISMLGDRKGIVEGEKSRIWKEYSRLIAEIRPRFVIAENVEALRWSGLDTVLRDLAEIGYDAEWDIISAAAVGAPMRRNRIWILAYPHGALPEGAFLEAVERQLHLYRGSDGGDLRRAWPAEPRLPRMVHGPANQLYRDRHRVIGNAVCPQVVEVIGRAIMSVIDHQNVVGPNSPAAATTTTCL
jgi:DNA (cytosine-5)-methyltransferase 1